MSRFRPDKDQKVLTMNRVVLRRIVCAVDLSDRSVASLKRALQLARLHDGELFVVHVAEQRLASIESARRTTDAFSALRPHLDREPLALPVRWIVAHGNPASEVARFIRRMNADLAVVGAALPRPSAGVIGAVAHAIVRTTTCPVLVIPPAFDNNASPKPYREILCGVSSGLSTATLHYALSLAQEFESRLTILNVEVDHVPGNDDAWVEAHIDGLRTEIPGGARNWCVIDELVTSGEPAQEVVKATQRLRSDLVVVGSTGAQGSEGGLGAAALGTLMLTDAEVLVVPAPGTAREIPMAA
jgi:nucleotide-binding universal stress UspA family protein